MAGHEVVCCTMRYKEEGGDVEEALANKVDAIVYTGRKAKHKFLRDKGIDINVWIDDNPHWIHQDAAPHPAYHSYS
jgi:hypothetical protein